MSWQLAPVLMVSFLPTNEYRQEFKAIFKSSNMTQVFTFQDFADTDGNKETENYEESRKIDHWGKVCIDQESVARSDLINKSNETFHSF